MMQINIFFKMIFIAMCSILHFLKCKLKKKFIHLNYTHSGLIRAELIFDRTYRIINIHLN
jgi:hypothetical protein